MPEALMAVTVVIYMEPALLGAERARLANRAMATAMANDRSDIEYLRESIESAIRWESNRLEIRSRRRRVPPEEKSNWLGIRLPMLAISMHVSVRAQRVAARRFTACGDAGRQRAVSWQARTG
jgi:hypothetical protein